MSTEIKTEHFKNALLVMLDETFDNVHGIYLDRGTSMFETLATITADQASIQVGGRCATLAAQVRHTGFYLDVLEESVRTRSFKQVDWGQIWRETNGVSADEWQAIKDSLRASYDRVKALIRETAEWLDENPIGAAMAIVVHTAYHLGEIRQALCTLQA